MCVDHFVVMLFVLFFFKQKTAYEMRISDWSSDVCSSDLPAERQSRLPCLPSRGPPTASNECPGPCVAIRAQLLGGRHLPRQATAHILQPSSGYPGHGRTPDQPKPPPEMPSHRQPLQSTHPQTPRRKLEKRHNEHHHKRSSMEKEHQHV